MILFVLNISSCLSLIFLCFSIVNNLILRWLWYFALQSGSISIFLFCKIVLKIQLRHQIKRQKRKKSHKNHVYNFFFSKFMITMEYIDQRITLFVCTSFHIILNRKKKNCRCLFTTLWYTKNHNFAKISRTITYSCRSTYYTMKEHSRVHTIYICIWSSFVSIFWKIYDLHKDTDEMSSLISA